MSPLPFTPKPFRPCFVINPRDPRCSQVFSKQAAIRLETLDQISQQREHLKPSALEAFAESQGLKTQLANQKTRTFIPANTREEQVTGLARARKGTRFHLESCGHALAWPAGRASVDGVSIINRVHLYSGLKCDGIEKANGSTASQFEESSKRIINEDNLFTEICHLLFVFYC